MGCCFWFKVFLFFYLVYIVLIIRFINKCFAIQLQAFKNIPEDVKQKYSAFYRKEIHDLKKWKLIIGAIFLLPWRFPLSILCVIGWNISCRYLTWGEDMSKPYSQELRRKIKSHGKFWNQWIIFFMCACWKVEVIKKDFAEFDPEYKEMDETIDHEKIPLIIMNHMGLADGHILWSLGDGPAIMAKIQLSRAPIYGTLFKRCQAPFVDRADPVQRANILNLIKERIRQSQTSTMPPLMLFPEGGVSNGASLLTFKRGAFFTHTPVKIYCLQIVPDQYQPWNCDAGDFLSLMFGMCNFSCRVKMYTFDRLFDPTYLNLDKDDENAWKIYAQKVRSIMAKCLGVPMVELGYTQSKEFTKIYQKIKKDLIIKYSGKSKKDKKHD